MYKKAGIIVGTVIIILSVVIYWIGSSSREEGESNKTPSSSLNTGGSQGNVQTEPIQPTPTPVRPVEPEPAPVVKTEPVTIIEYIDKIPKGTKIFSVLEDGSLADPVRTNEEVMFVAKKKIVLMDSNYDELDGKQLVYSVDLLNSDNSFSISLYLNKTAYDGVLVGDKLKVTYAVHTNSSQVEFPVVITAEKVE